MSVSVIFVKKTAGVELAILTNHCKELWTCGCKIQREAYTTRMETPLVLLQIFTTMRCNTMRNNTLQAFGSDPVCVQRDDKNVKECPLEK